MTSAAAMIGLKFISNRLGMGAISEKVLSKKNHIPPPTYVVHFYVLSKLSKVACAEHSFRIQSNNSEPTRTKRHSILSFLSLKTQATLKNFGSCISKKVRRPRDRSGPESNHFSIRFKVSLTQVDFLFLCLVVLVLVS